VDRVIIDKRSGRISPSTDGCRLLAPGPSSHRIGGTTIRRLPCPASTMNSHLLLIGAVSPRRLVANRFALTAQSRRAVALSPAPASPLSPNPAERLRPSRISRGSTSNRARGQRIRILALIPDACRAPLARRVQSRPTCHRG
jgi:hypothetical protein